MTFRCILELELVVYSIKMLGLLEWANMFYNEKDVNFGGERAERYELNHVLLKLVCWVLMLPLSPTLSTSECNLETGPSKM